ncbi:Gfo/Idh/MocA family protein [Craterilacuibacter sp.]|uniref:Gfo/Idh/MocA family protein n=1 Tax=Craterilacuibacter sp. TaxID=2870909 RepID=UPI003F33C43D
MKINLAVVGLGKMGLSHLAMINAHPNVQVAAICDASGYVLDVLEKYTGLQAFSDYERMLREVALDAVIIATPSAMHAPMVRAALDRGLHVFCEKPFCLDDADGEALTRQALHSGVVNQVGYHCRFVGAFQEVKRLLDLGVIGEISHVQAEAYGPVVLKPKGSSWRSKHSEGGGCLYDYAAHPLNLVTWYLGLPQAVGGTVLNSVFSAQTDDEVFATLYYAGGKSAQLSVSWSDESFRKMSTTITILGTKGRIKADRQECQVFLRDTATLPAGYQPGWNVRYTTELTEPVWFYVRGEEYSAQLDYFVNAILSGNASGNINSFSEAQTTDRVISMLIEDARRGPLRRSEEQDVAKKRWSFFA